MAEIRVTACGSHNGGPTVHYHLYAYLSKRKWPGGGDVPVLRLNFGNDTVEVWPADPDKILSLAEKLTKIARELKGGQ